MTEWDRHVKRLEKLADERKQILALEGKQALDAILDHPQPNALVHSFAEEDLVFLIHDIGPEDSLDLIAMASNRQWDYIFDIESWEKDRINLLAVTQWMDLMLKADPQRFINWATEERPNLIEYFLFHSIELVIREHDQDPSDFEDGFITYDDIYYFRIPENKYATDAESDFKIQHRELLNKMMHLMASMDHFSYQQILLRAAGVIPAESEEEAFRLRNFRLAEKGFLPFHEAVGVFAPIRVDHLKNRKKVMQDYPEPETYVPAPVNHASMMEGDSIFRQALGKITHFNILQQLHSEFAGVCNQLAAAEKKPVRSREDLKSIVKKATAYISIGLESLVTSGKTAPGDSATAAPFDEYIKTYPLIDLFRTGYGRVADMRQQAKDWQQSSWFAANGLSLSFWGERLVGTIGGLLIKRPMFYDSHRRGDFYREFETMADIEHTEAVLKETMAYDKLLAAMDISDEDFETERFITFENLLMTLWARHCLGLSPGLEPIPIDLFRPFFKDLWEPGKTPPEIRESKKTDLLQWLAARSGRPEEEISKDLGNALEILFDEIAKDYGTIRTDDLDPRFVTIFMLSDD